MRFLDHTQTHHTRLLFSGGEIGLSQWLVSGNSQPSKERDIHDPCGIRTCISIKRAAADLRHRPLGHCNWLYVGYICIYVYTTTGGHKLIIKQFIDACLNFLEVFRPVHYRPASSTEEECVESYLHFSHVPTWHAEGHIRVFVFMVHMFVSLKSYCVQDRLIYDLCRNTIFICDILGSHSVVNAGSTLMGY